MRNLTTRSKFLIKVIIFLYLAFSFYNWSLNPATWSEIERIAIVLLFAIVAEKIPKE